MSKALVIDAYRFCSTVHVLLHNENRVYVTNDRFLIGRMGKHNPTMKTFGESKGIKLPYCDFDNSPVKAAKLFNSLVMVRSSMGARRVEQALQEFDEVYLACLYNASCYVGERFDRTYVDDNFDEYCLHVIQGRERSQAYEEMLMATKRNLDDAISVFYPDFTPIRIKVIPEDTLLRAVICN